MRRILLLSPEDVERIQNGEDVMIIISGGNGRIYLRKSTDKKVPNEKDMTPRIITICGSYQFSELMFSEYKRLTELGYIVLMPAIGCEARSKEWYLNLHYEKISMSDAIYVIDKGGHIGESTQLEIDKAKELGKIVYRWSRNDI